MARVRALDSNQDWTFGQSAGNYLADSDAIAQNISTRIKSFKNDWFLDVEKNIDWFNILGAKNNKQTIISEVFRVSSNTQHVRKIIDVQILSVDAQRNAEISVIYQDIFYNELTKNIIIENSDNE